MKDRELNLAIHQEVEMWHWDQWFKDYRRCRTEDDCSYEEVHPMRGGQVPDYCHDAVWCLRMMEKHKLIVDCYSEPPVTINTGRGKLIRDPSLTRAVALAVMAIHREGK